MYAFNVVHCTLIDVDHCVCVCVCLLQILASTYDDDLKKKKEHSKRSESSEDVALSGGFMWNDR